MTIVKLKIHPSSPRIGKGTSLSESFRDYTLGLIGRLRLSDRCRTAESYLTSFKKLLLSLYMRCSHPFWEGRCGAMQKRFLFFSFRGFPIRYSSSLLEYPPGSRFFSRCCLRQPLRALYILTRRSSAYERISDDRCMLGGDPCPTHIAAFRTNA